VTEPRDDRVGKLADHHLGSRVSQRHVESDVGEQIEKRRLGHLQTRIKGATEVKEARAQTLEERLLHLTPLQHAVVMAEILGQPRVARPHVPPHRSRRRG
jgi:hypothetical protein